MQIKIINLPYHIVSREENIDDICQNLKISKSNLVAINQVTNISEGDVLLLPNSYNRCYVVQPLDTIKTIAKKLEISEEELTKKLSTNFLYVGMKILI